MRLARGKPSREAKPTAALIVGDGPTDEAVVEAAAKHYNHTKTITSLEQPVRQTGLRKALERAWYIAAKLGITRIIIVIDKEHLPHTQRELEEEMRRAGLHPARLEKPHPNLTIVHAETNPPNPTRATILLVAMGDSPPSIEADIAKLIREVYGEEVKPTKQAIHKWQREKGTTIKKLVERASRQQLEKAIPHLAKALQLIAQEN